MLLLSLGRFGICVLFRIEAPSRRSLCRFFKIRPLLRLMLPKPRAPAFCCFVWESIMAIWSMGIEEIESFDRFFIDPLSMLRGMCLVVCGLMVVGGFLLLYLDEFNFILPTGVDSNSVKLFPLAPLLKFWNTFVLYSFWCLKKSIHTKTLPKAS